MLEKQAWIENVMEAFITGWTQCRMVPGTEVSTDGKVKHVRFGSCVRGRFLEYFYWGEDSGSLKQSFNSETPHWVTIFSQNFQRDSLIDKMESLGYTFLARESLMILSGISKLNRSDGRSVQKVHTLQQAEWLNDYYQTKKVDVDRLEDDSVHDYYIKLDGKPVCTGRFSIKDDWSCLDGIYTLEDYRRQGLAASLCSRMLDEIKGSGIDRNVLGSSEMGYVLYKKLGYETVIPMYVFKSGC